MCDPLHEVFFIFFGGNLLLARAVVFVCTVKYAWATISTVLMLIARSLESGS